MCVSAPTPFQNLYPPLVVLCISQGVKQYLNVLDRVSLFTRKDADRFLMNVYDEEYNVMQLLENR